MHFACSNVAAFSFIGISILRREAYYIIGVTAGGKVAAFPNAKAAVLTFNIWQPRFPVRNFAQKL